MGAHTRGLRPVEDRRGRGCRGAGLPGEHRAGLRGRDCCPAGIPDRIGGRAKMRFVDEFRDADKAHALAAKIAGLCEPGRQYKLMEVCGGHTHTIYKHGLEDYLPESVTLVHGPGCPVCVIPMGSVDDAIHLASQPDVIMTSFGDMMRAASSPRSPCLRKMPFTPCRKRRRASVSLTQAVTTSTRSTRLNSSHLGISYAVFCLKKIQT